MKNIQHKVSKKKHTPKKVKVVDRNTQRDIDERRKAVKISSEKSLAVFRDLYAPFFRKICENSNLTAVLLGKTTPVNYASYLRLKKGSDTKLSTFLRSMHRLFESQNYRFYLAREFDAIISAVSQGKYVVMKENVSKEDLDQYPESSHYFVHSTNDQYDHSYPKGEVSKEERDLLKKQSIDRADAFVKFEVNRFAHAYYSFVDLKSIEQMDEKTYISHSSYEKLFSGKPMCISTFIRMVTSFYQYSRRKYSRTNRFEALERAVANGTSIVLLVVPYDVFRKYDKNSYLFF